MPVTSSTPVRGATARPEPRPVRHWRDHVSRLALGLFVFLFVVDLGLAMSTHANWLGDVPAMLGWEGPLLALGLLLRSPRRHVRRLTAVLAAVFALWAGLLLVMNVDALPSTWGLYVVMTQSVYFAVCVAAFLVEVPAFLPRRNR